MRHGSLQALHKSAEAVEVDMHPGSLTRRTVLASALTAVAGAGLLTPGRAEAATEWSTTRVPAKLLQRDLATLRTASTAGTQRFGAYVPDPYWNWSAWPAQLD